MLTDSRVEHILDRLPRLTIGVLGDLFLDRYFDIDGALTEPSIETGLDAYQVVRVRSSPGAAGTVINNLVALGVGRVCPVAVIGDDGEGYELRQALSRMKCIDARWITSSPDRRTPTYTKPMLQQLGQPRELNRLDIKNRAPLPGPLEDLIVEGLTAIWPQIDALLVLDQVSEENCGVVTTRVREELARMGEVQPAKFVLADSRERIGLFRSVSLKPNRRECCEAIFPAPGMSGSAPISNPEEMIVDVAVTGLVLQCGRPVFCTDGEQGILVSDPFTEPILVPAYPVSGPIDIIGAGDSTSAGIACAVAAGASLTEAAAFGCLVASITVQQLGTTGTASPEQVRQRWQQVRGEGIR